jgi:homoserine kinase
LEDVVAEPYRSKVIPAYGILKQAAKTAGALGTSISGSGPSIFSLCQGIDIAKKISSAQKKVLNSTDVSFEVYISKINTKGVSIL